MADRELFERAARELHRRLDQLTDGLTKLAARVTRLETKPPPSGGGGAGHTIQDEGVPLPARANLNFTGAGVTATDNAITGATDVTVGGGGGGHIIQDEGVDLPAEPRLDFSGSSVTVTDVAGIKTLVTISTHNPVTLSADADANLLDLAGQVIGLDNQSANKIFAGPSAGVPAPPTFRSVVQADLGIGTPTGAKFLKDNLSWDIPSGTPAGELLYIFGHYH